MAATFALDGLRVLVIDDNEDAAECVAWLFKDAGAIVEAVKDATGVAELVQKLDPQLVLLDLTLPKVDGYEACQIIRRLKGAIPFIAAVTGWGDAEHRIRSKQVGFDLHLTKPVASDVLMEVGRLALGRMIRCGA
jgi:CheY-like chemotaxis protein